MSLSQTLLVALRSLRLNPMRSFLTILGIVIGIVTLLVAGGLRHGRRVARLVVTVIMVLQIVGGIVTATGGQAQLLSGLVQIAIAVAVIALLWTGEAKQFFRR